MALAKIYKGDIGQQILLDAGQDISAASLLQMKYKKPDGSTGTWAATLVGLDSAYHNTILGDLDQTGNWEIQLYIELGVVKLHGAIVSFHVYKKVTD